VRFTSNIYILLTMIGTLVMSSSEGNAVISCDTFQISQKPVKANAVSADLAIPFGFLCHSLEAKGKEISAQKAAYSSNGTVVGPLVIGICNWSIDFVYYDTKGKEYMRDKGETVAGCDKGPTRAIANGKKLYQPGSACVQLITDGEVRLTQCHAMKD
jgi:hypothetical protein